jgi:hypothetical protein
MGGNKMIRNISDGIQTFITEYVISGFLKLIDDYKVLEKFGVGGDEE